MSYCAKHYNEVEQHLAQGWANFLIRGPQWVLTFDKGAGPGADGWSALVPHLIGEKIHILGYGENMCFNFK